MTGAGLLLRRHTLQAPTRENLEIFDRVGGGDSFASGLILRLFGRQGAAVGR